MKTIKILAFSMMATSGMLLTSCGDDDKGGSTLPPIGGYNTADEVAATDLLAYWPLNGDGKESISGAMPANSVGASYATAVKGQGVKLTSGYLNYGSIPNLNIQSSSLTISCWVKISNTKMTADGPSVISPIISFAGGPDANVGNLSIFGNTHGLVSSDSIQMKAQYQFSRPDGTPFGGDCVNMIKQESWMDNTHTWNANKIGGQWAHVVYTWDAATATNKLYVNGAKISNSAWEERNNDPEGNTQPMPMSFFTPNHPIIGALNSVVDGTNAEAWNAALTGEVDEIRVFKKVLIQADINALYELEKAGR
ncbi:MAG: hypothetical protein DI539_14760 [Flavobacterium psychrophilum]|nr:MAG: hypothetical protein DI539_14760 [Flavobacterium psychrophilum]